jgi:hypothetical protein
VRLVGAGSCAGRDAERTEAAQLIAQYKTIRHIISQVICTAFARKTLSAVQYVSKDRSSVVFILYPLHIRHNCQNSICAG